MGKCVGQHGKIYDQPLLSFSTTRHKPSMVIYVCLDLQSVGFVFLRRRYVHSVFAQSPHFGVAVIHHEHNNVIIIFRPSDGSIFQYCTGHRLPEHRRRRQTVSYHVARHHLNHIFPYSKGDIFPFHISSPESLQCHALYKFRLVLISFACCIFVSSHV